MSAGVGPSLVRTKSGTEYEFEWDEYGKWLRTGKVRKDGGEWAPCNMLTPIQQDRAMVMVLGFEHDSPMRHTSRVKEILK